MADMDYSCAGVNRTFQHDLATDIWYSWMWMEGLTNPDKKNDIYSHDKRPGTDTE